MYKKLNYYDMYGFSIFIFVILMLVLFLVINYFYVMKNIQPIKDDWVNQRCKPQNIPFAGFINKPTDSTIIDYTKDNFTFCIQNILKSITGYAVEPITYITSILNNLVSEIVNAVNSIRTILSKVRTNVENISTEILGRIANIMVPIQAIFINFIDTFGKIKGVLASGIYTTLGAYYTLKSLLGAIVQFVLIILMILVAIIFGFWLFPFTWPMAITGTAIFLTASIPLAAIIIFMSLILHVDVNSPMPELKARPTLCFDKETLLKLNNGDLKHIINVNVGDKLENNSTITAKLKLDANGVEMFNINNVIVSGSHRIKYKEQWIFVKDHPERIKIDSYNEPFIYCLNTDTKIIKINSDIFGDWDEIYDKESLQLFNYLNSCGVSTNKLSDIHKYFDKGFVGTTMLSLINNDIRDEANQQRSFRSGQAF